MKTLFIFTFILFTAISARGQVSLTDEELRAILKAEIEKLNKEGDPINVAYFRPRVITPEWSVVLATVKTLKPETTEKLQIDQSGKVTLSIHKVLYGKPLTEITLPYRYNNFDIYKSKDLELRKKHTRSMIETGFVWPNLVNLTKPYLLVVINPRASDPLVSSSDKLIPLAAKVVEVSGEKDPQVVELLKQIPKATEKKKQ